MKRRDLLTLALLSPLVAPALAADPAWPSKPLRIIVPYPAGGTADAAARLLADKLKTATGQSVVIDNRGGASGTTGIDALAKSLPDGNTLAFSAISPVTLSPQLHRVAYDPLRDVIPVAQVMYSPVYLIASTAFTGKTFADLIAQAKARPGEISIATSGTGSVGHVMLEQISRRAGVKFNHIPYKGGPQVINDAVGGQFDLFTINPSPSVNSLIAQGKLRVLAVAAPQRLPTVADVPTLIELGQPDANLNSMFGFFAPVHTPPEVLARINETVNRLLADSEVQARLAGLDNIVSPGSIDVFRQRVEREFAANARIVKEAGITAD